eukprot:gnl/TRDRNA2_/TRDRNA2_91702_c0_seq1.p1 gnl/TRDRNA2_/TRDRNA2_91702_c0~~gnl/TRDRNA2_/TRDRNA2_91702_c0_seq1.p1  ORF type:complete len:575 (+),score=56.43 gnl/TRDRNA2_/TRDRNA2_91702_c0_seq1:53-1726(+)
MTPVVTITQGRLQGETKDGVTRFLNVPYCQAPVGPLRWKPPQPCLPWQGVRTNPERLSKCPQPKIEEDFEGPPLEGHTVIETEDCLVLNIFTPEAAVSGAQADDSGNLLPVIFYIHGGAGKLGCCHPDGLSGHDLAKDQQVCYVAANYRLGLFGFLAHPDLSAEDELASGGQNGSGNYGILDLIAALEWVKANVEAFGGDPGNITIWGLSTGSQFVNCLLFCPLATDLFHRAVMQSCVDLGNVRMLKSGSDIWLGKSAEEWGCAVGEELGCPASEGQLQAMRALSANVIANGSFRRATADSYLPATDRRNGSSRPLAAMEALQAGKINRVPLMIGSTQQDGLGKMELEHTMFEETDVSNLQQLRSLFKREFDTKDIEAQSHYPHHPHPARPVSSDADVERALSDFSKDIWYEGGTWIMADEMARLTKPPPVFLYLFTEKVSFTGGKAKSYHGADQHFWNGRKPILRPNVAAESVSHTDPKNTKLGATMMEYLGNFARSGNPNGPDLPRWDPHVSGGSQCMQLGPALGMMTVSPEARERYGFLAKEYFGKRVLSELQK